ncbi:hypothetical protein IFM89_013621 [Coptis chinensis]|uniref:Carboxypeptidase n=1 Tax=Coptis chinensis TaxID=261450 RepID=A0A835IML6_9MAGN|nr:hypothetical protein IFM89_013621 [Coptis chinensis]
MEMKRRLLFFHLFFLLVKLQTSSSTSCSFDSEPAYQQQEKDRVLELPGLSVNVSFEHYSGFVTVNEESGRNLFYWFLEAVEDPSSKPLVIWLEGGPGCSSVGSEAERIGPFSINPDGKTLYLNPYSWNQVANIIFLESPVGTGFSYSSNPSEYLTNGDKRTADDSLVFLLKWFERFPQYKGRDFYITGESYAGHYIPQLAQAIVRTFRIFRATGLISDQTYKLRNTFCSHASFVHSPENCSKISDVITLELGNIDIYSIYTPTCTSNVSDSDIPPKRRYVGNINEEYDPCTLQYSGIYFNLPEVQKALHVNPAKWEFCRPAIYTSWKDSATSVLDIYQELIASGLRIWMFSGDTDGVIPVTSTRYDIDALRLPLASPWRAWYDDGQVGGWTEQYVGLNFVAIRGAGHRVPATKPKLALVLFKSFLSGNPMPSLLP